MSLDHLIERLPHQRPFLFVSRILTLEPEHVVASWDVRGDEWFLEGHFPDKPLVPGVLITEALAQAAGLAADPGEERTGGMLVSSDMRFRTPVTPPASIELDARLIRSIGQLHLLEVAASVEGARCAEGTLGLLVGEHDEADA